MEVFPYKDNNKFIQFDRHFGLFWPSPPSLIPKPGYGVHSGFGRLSWGLGGHADNGGGVLADNARLISTGHQVNHVIVFHSNVPPWPIGVNILIPLLVLASSNESVFACSSVVAADGPVAVSAISRDTGWNMACNDPVSMPTSIVTTNGTVLLNFTRSDFLKGLADAAVIAAWDFAFSLIPIPNSFKRKFGMFYHRLIKKIPGFEAVGGGVYRATNGQYASIPQKVADILIPAAASTIKDISEYLTGD